MKEKELFFANIELLNSSMSSRKDFKRIKNNFKKVFYGNISFILVISVIIAIIVVMLAGFFLMSILMNSILSQNLNVFTLCLSLIIYVTCIIILGRKGWNILYERSYKFLSKQIKPPINKNLNFLKYYCNDKKLNREELYEYKKKYIELNKKWKKANNFYIETMKTFIVILFIITFILNINPIVDSLKQEIGYTYIIDSVMELIKYLFLLAFALQSIEFSYNQSSFKEIIERYDYIICFGYDRYEVNYQV